MRYDGHTYTRAAQAWVLTFVLGTFGAGVANGASQSDSADSPGSEVKRIVIPRPDAPARPESQVERIQIEPPGGRTVISPGAGDRALDDPRGTELSAPEGCGDMVELNGQLMQAFDATVSEGARRLGEGFVASRPRGMTPAEAWDRLGVAFLLRGAGTAAVWSGVHAVAAGWAPMHVSNTGAFLYNIRRCTEARAYFECAETRGYRSPQLLEGLAATHDCMGNAGLAQRYIREAAAAAPHDRVIEVSAALATGSEVPPPAGDGPDLEPLERALADLINYQDDTRRCARERVTALVDLYGNEVGAPNLEVVDMRAERDQSILKVLRDHIEQAEMTREEYRQVLAERGASDRFDERVYQRLLAELFNAALRQILSQIAETSGWRLEMCGVYAAELPFWAEVLGLDAERYAREHLQPVHFSAVRVHPPRLDERYRERVDAAEEAYRKRRDACLELDDDAFESCLLKAEAAFCAARAREMSKVHQQIEARIDRGANRFDAAAQELLLWGGGEALHSRELIQSHLESFRPIPYPTPAVAVMGPKAQIEALAKDYEYHVLRLLFEPDVWGGVTDFLREQAQWFTDERAVLERRIAYEVENHAEQCAPIERAYLELLKQEEWAAYREVLLARIDADIREEFDATVDCEFEIAGGVFKANIKKPVNAGFEAGASVGPVPVGVSIASDGKLEGSHTFEWNDDLDVSSTFKLDGRDLAGADVSAGGSVPYGPFRGRGKVSLFTEPHPQTGRWDGGVALSGSAGFGWTSKSKKVKVSCYPGSASVKIYARALMEDTVAYYRHLASRP